MTIPKIPSIVLYHVALQEARLGAQVTCLQKAMQIGSGPLGELRTAQVNGLFDLADLMLDPIKVKEELRKRNKTRWKNPELLQMFESHIDELRSTALQMVIRSEQVSSPHASSPEERNARVAEMHQELVYYYLNTAVNFSLAERSRGG